MGSLSRMRTNLVLWTKPAHCFCSALCLQRFFLFSLFIFNRLFILSGSLLFSCFAMKNFRLFYWYTSGNKGRTKRNKKRRLESLSSYNLTNVPNFSQDKNKSHWQSDEATWPHRYSADKEHCSLVPHCRVKMGT